MTRIEYKPDTDQIIGFVPPLLGSTGLPATNGFPATSASIVKNYFDCNADNKARSVYALVAVPLTNKATPYVVAIFGTNNRFSFENVLTR